MQKVLLLMGASGGIGRAILPQLCEAGYQLALHYHLGFDSLQEELTRCKPKTKVGLFQADIKSEGSIREMVDAVITEYGRIDVLVNNAGYPASGISWKTPLEEWEKSIQINLTGPFLTIKHVLPHMRQQNGGRIINVSSVVAQYGMPGTSAYAAAKSGLVGMTHSIAKEVAAQNITINTISFGYMDAGMINELNPDLRQAITGIIPQQRLGPAREVASAINYLAGNDASYVTGQVLNVNGGLYW